MPRIRYYTLKQAVAMICDDSFVGDDVDITILPPEQVDQVSDEEEVDDDGTGEAVVQEVAGPVELYFHDSTMSTNEQDSGEVSSSQSPVTVDEPEPPAVLSPVYNANPAPKRRRTVGATVTTASVSMPPASPATPALLTQPVAISSPVWKKCPPKYDFAHPHGSMPDSLKADLSAKLPHLTPTELFEELFSPDMFDLMAAETQRYAKHVKNDVDFVTSPNELRAFVGILLFSGYNIRSSEKDYWSEADDLKAECVQNVMPKNRYMKLKSSLHFVDNSLVAQNCNDRAFKIRPLIESLNRNFIKFGVFARQLSIDEMIVRYYGHHGLKQFIRGKPIRFGYKYWAICSHDGYCFQFQLYCGKETVCQQQMPLGSCVVLSLLSIVPQNNLPDYTVHFDNFFTSHNLMATLSKMSVRATGTVRENRTARCPLSSVKSVSKEQRGFHDHRFDTANKVLLVRWHDNSVVTIATNYDTVIPMASCRRWSKDAKEAVSVSQPRLIKHYNQAMGGVDLHDWHAGKYGIQIRGKKWYWPLFIRSIDMAAVNAWILHRYVHGSDAMDQKEFRRHIVTSYMKMM